MIAHVSNGFSPRGAIKVQQKAKAYMRAKQIRQARRSAAKRNKTKEKGSEPQRTETTRGEATPEDDAGKI